MAKNKQITIEKLAEMIQKGFEQTTTKTELKATNETVALLKDELERIGADIHDIKITLGPLVRIAGAQEREIRDLQNRMMRVEKKVGFAR